MLLPRRPMERGRGGGSGCLPSMACCGRTCKNGNQAGRGHARMHACVLCPVAHPPGRLLSPQPPPPGGPPETLSPPAACQPWGLYCPMCALRVCVCAAPPGHALPGAWRWRWTAPRTSRARSRTDRSAARWPSAGEPRAQRRGAGGVEPFRSGPARPSPRASQPSPHRTQPSPHRTAP